jgi:8-oxo-dGTP diphosphatase
MTETHRQPAECASGTPIRAAGAVLWRRRRDGTIETALVHRPKYDDWSLPKGKLEPGEHVTVAAVREVAEETGHVVALGRPLPTLRYAVGGRPKEVRYWACEAADGTFTPTHEVDDLAWLPLPEAAQRLSWERDATVVSALLEAPLDTVALLLLRHGSAVPREDWPGEGDDRPLDEAGVAQACALIGPLSAYGVTRVLSSPTERTLETVAPYAVARRCAVEGDPLLSDEGFAGHPDGALMNALDLLESPAPTVVCSHRPVLPWLVTTLLTNSVLPTPSDMLPPGAFHVLHVHGGRAIALEQHEV